MDPTAFVLSALASVAAFAGGLRYLSRPFDGRAWLACAAITAVLAAAVRLLTAAMIVAANVAALAIR